MKVCIFGQMHNGKTTFANMLQKELNALAYLNIIMENEERKLGGWKIRGFATALKDYVAIKYGVTREFVDYWKSLDQIPPSFSVTMRDILQREGQLARDCKPTVWIDRIMSETDNLIIDDGRYLNEAKAVYDSGGYNILIVRNGFYNESNHKSEREIGDVALELAHTGIFPPEWRGLIHEVVANHELDLLKKTAKTTAITIFDKIKGKNNA